MAKMFEIRVEFERILELLGQGGAGGGVSEKLTEEEAALLRQELEAWRDEARRPERVDYYAEQVRAYEVRIAARNAEAKALFERAEEVSREAEAYERKLHNFKQWLLLNMRAFQFQKMQGTTFTLSRYKYGGKPPMTMLVPDDLVPDRFCEQRRVIDKNKIRDAIDAGDEDAKKLAAIGERGEGIKVV